MICKTERIRKSLDILYYQKIITENQRIQYYKQYKTIKEKPKEENQTPRTKRAYHKTTKYKYNGGNKMAKIRCECCNEYYDLINFPVDKKVCYSCINKSGIEI